MAGKSFGEEFGEEFARKAVMWGTAIAGATLPGPVGIVLRLLTSVATMTSGNGNLPPPSGEQDVSDRKKTGSSGAAFFKPGEQWPC